MRNFALGTLLLLGMMPSMSMAQSSKPAVDYLKVPGPIPYGGSSYKLSWSSHPAANLYKQEYLAGGEQADKYKSMILLDVITGDASVKTTVGAKINELRKMKETNPMVNYEVIDNPATGEYLVDFLLSANAPDGSTSIIEHNQYRYKPLTLTNGSKAILLFGISTREYGANVNRFLVALKSTRKEGMNRLAKFTLPAISL